MKWSVDLAESMTASAAKAKSDPRFFTRLGPGNEPLRSTLKTVKATVQGKWSQPSTTDFPVQTYSNG